MWIKDGDATPQLIASAYSTVRRTGSVTALERKEIDSRCVTLILYDF
jgi:hypothetical protein